MSPLQMHLSAKVTSIETPNSCIGPTSEPVSGAIQIYSVKDVATRAELIWALKSISSNYSAASCDGITDVFNAMFPDKVPQGFSLSKAKLSYLVTDALGPYFHDQMIKDAQGEFYSVQFDETTNVENQKELQVGLRYWSKNRDKIQCMHLESFFLGHATGEILLKHILLALENSNLSLNHMLSLGSDGPNVNKKVHRIINEKVLSVRGSSLINIGTCQIHIVHNAFLKGLGELGEECSDVVISVYSFFDSFPSRWEDYGSVQREMKVPEKKFIKHVSSRWLTLQDSCERLLEQSPALEKYFLNYIPKNCSSLMMSTKYKTICSFLKCPTYKAELSFVVSSAELFRGFTKRFQKEGPLIHIVYHEVKNLCCTLIGRVCKTDVLTEIKKQTILDPENIFGNDKNLLPLKNVVINSRVESNLKHLKEIDVISFMKNVQLHYITACKYLLQKTCLSQLKAASFLKHLRFLQPKERSSNGSCVDIVKVAKALPVVIPTDILIDEWRSLQLEQVETKEKCDIDEYWKIFMNIMLPCGTPKYPNVAKVIKMCLTLSHGSAEIERGFSQSGRILTQDKAAMSLRMLNARINIQQCLKMYGNKPELIPITRELIALARCAHASYMMHLDSERLMKKTALKK